MRTIPDELTDLALFARIVEQRSFTQAAAQLGISKSVLSERLARLEKRAGVRLLHRTTRKVTLTDAGAALYPSCARLVQNADDAERALVSLEDGVERDVRGTVRVSTDTNFGRQLLPNAIADACDAFPQLTVEIDLDDSFVDVVHGGFDLVIRCAKKLDSGDVGRKLGTSPRIVIASPKYLAKHGTPRTPHDLVTHRCLRYRFRTPTTEWGFLTPKGLRTVSVDGPFVANVDSALIQAAIAGLGITVMSRAVVHEELARGELVQVLADFPLQPVTIWALHPWRRRPPPRVRVLVDAIANAMRVSGRYDKP